MNRTSRRALLIIAAFALFLVPAAAIAAGGFTDVADDNVFHDDIQWMQDSGVTKGCNPPTNDKYCPDRNVTRGQMAAFMHRLATSRVVDANTVEGMTVADLMTGEPGPQGPQGDTGPAGPQGDQGEPGVVGSYTVTGGSAEIPAFTGSHPSRGTDARYCNLGDIATGGGFDTYIGSADSRSVVEKSRRVVHADGRQGWEVIVRNDSPSLSAVFNLEVVCLDVTP